MAALNLSLYPPSISSTVEPDHGIVLDYADGGKLHRRGLYASQYFTVSMNWDLLTLAQRDYLETFLLLNRLETVTFTLDGHDYTSELIGGPVRRWVDGTLYGLSAQFRATRITATDPIAALFARLGASGVYVDPLTLSSVWADTAGISVAVIAGAVARIDALPGAPTQARFWNDTAAQRATLRADGLEFDGTDDRLAFPDNTALRFGTTDFTIAASIYPDITTGSHGIVSKRGTGSATTVPGWGLRQNAATIEVEYDHATAAGLYSLTGNVLTAATWTDVVVQLNRGGGQFTAYINAVAQTPVAVTVGNIDGTQPLVLGACSNAVNFYNGKIGRALAINKILSVADRTIVNDWINGGHG